MQVPVKSRNAVRAENAAQRESSWPSQAQPGEDVMVAYLLIVLLSVLIFLCLPGFSQTSR